MARVVEYQKDNSIACHHYLNLVHLILMTLDLLAYKSHYNSLNFDDFRFTSS